MDRRWAVAAVLSVSLAAGCGTSEQVYSGSTGTCTYASGQNKICTYYNYSGALAVDPAATATAASTEACTSSDPNGVFVAGNTCSTTGAVGFCTLSETLPQNAETFTFSETTVWPAGMNAGALQSLCQGTWSTTAP